MKLKDVNYDKMSSRMYEMYRLGKAQTTRRGIDPKTTVEEFIEYFKDKPDILQGILVGLRKDKITKILKNV